MDATLLKKQLNYEISSGNYSSSIGLINNLLTNSSKHELPGLYYYLFKLLSPNIHKFNLETIKLAFVTSFVSKSIESYITVDGFVSGYNIETLFAHFYNYEKEIIDKNSDFYKFNPDIIVLLIRTEELLKDISVTNYNEIENNTNEIYDHVEALIHHLENNTQKKCILIVHSFNYPIYSVREISLGQLGNKIKREIDELNNKLLNLNSNKIIIYHFDHNYFLFLYGYKNIFNEISNLVSQNPYNQNAYMYLSKEYIRYLFMHSGKSIKCIAIDADDTLWGGTISEDGINNIQLGNYYPGNVFVEFQKCILELYNKGIILILLSKNDIEDVENVFDNNQNMILKKHHFAVIKANWSHKAINLQEAVEELNIGIDSVLFIDNNPHERDEMRRIHPEVKIIELPVSFEKYKEALMEYIISEKNEIVNEDLKRNDLYYRKKQRKIHKEKFASIQDYYRSLNIKCCIGKIDPSCLGRAHDLLQRTNQFNLTTKRYTVHDLERLVSNPDADLYYYTYADIYGDDGIIGLIFINKNSISSIWEIDTFLMSCRVIGKTIEDAIINHFILKAREYNIKYLVGVYIPTNKNGQVSELYKKYGFEEIHENNSSSIVYKWSIDVFKSSQIECNWITINEI